MLNKSRNILSLAWQFYQQEKNYKHQRYMYWIQTTLMTFIVTLSLSSNNIQQFLKHNLDNLLGADVVISQSQRLNDTQLNKLKQLSSKWIVTQQVSTTLTHKEHWQQVKLKAVNSDYPLQGSLRISDSLNGVEKEVASGPEQGEIWLDSRALSSLSIKIGETLLVANRLLRVTNILLHEPDRLMEGHSVEMRALLHQDDFSQLGFAIDLIRYRYLVEADKQQTNQLIQWQKQALPAAQFHHKQGAHPLASFWKRTENLIGLVSIVLFFMAAIAIEQLTQVQMKKEQFFSAVCLSLGASNKSTLIISIVKWSISLLFITPMVLIVSAAFHWLVISWLATTFMALSWDWHIWVALKSVGATSLIFVIFRLPIWLSLRNASLAYLISNIKPSNNQWLSKLCAILVLFIVAFSYSDNALLTGMILTAITASVVLILAVSWISLTLAERGSQGFSGIAPFALYMMKQRLITKSTQILGVGLCAFLLLFTIMLLRDLGSTMADYQRQHDGNLMISQASEDQMRHVSHWASTQDIDIRQSKPYLFAKLTAVNDQSLDKYNDSPSESLATFKRAIRLHWTQAIPSNNEVVDGQWWDSDPDNWQQISVEQEVMTDLGLDIGDKMRFQIHQHVIDFSIVASHQYKSGAGSITFWVQMPATATKHINAPHYHMASLELKQEHWPQLSQLWQAHPTLRMISLKELTERFDKTLAMVTQVISIFSGLIIVLATIVILASISALESNEKKKNSIILSFGLTKSTCLKLNAIEWFFTGGIAAFGAIFGTYITGLMMYQSQFSLPYNPDILWLLSTLLVILLFVAGVGIGASKASLKSSVRQLLAEN